jgi:hypothetical protein
VPLGNAIVRFSMLPGLSHHTDLVLSNESILSHQYWKQVVGDRNSMLLDKSKILFEKLTRDLKTWVFLRANCYMCDLVLMPPQEFVDPAMCQHFMGPIFDFIEDFTFGGKIEIVCTPQNHFNHFSFLIVGGLVRSADRLTEMFLSLPSDATNMPDMSFRNLIDRGELPIIH